MPTIKDRILAIDANIKQLQLLHAEEIRELRARITEIQKECPHTTRRYGHKSPAGSDRLGGMTWVHDWDQCTECEWIEFDVVTTDPV